MADHLALIPYPDDELASLASEIAVGHRAVRESQALVIPPEKTH